MATAPSLANTGVFTSASTAGTKSIRRPSASPDLAEPPRVPASAQTPLRADAFARLLADHPNAHLRQLIVTTLRTGADIRYTGPQQGRYTKNSLSARIHHAALLQSIKKEVSLGHSVGPFPNPPLPHFVVNALGSRPKKDGGHRTIMDLSQPHGNSVNDHIRGDEMPLQYCSVDDAVRLITNAGKGAVMAKMDVKSAFRLIPVRTADWNLLGFRIRGEYYFDVVLPFGCRSSPYIFEFFSTAIHWCVEKKARLATLLHYVDDFFFVGRPGTSECELLMTSMQAVCSEPGVPLALDKTEGPATRLTFLGIELDSVTQTLSLPSKKQHDIADSFRSWHGRASCTTAELQSLIGTLSFASKCVPCSRLFTRRMIMLLSAFHGRPVVTLNEDFHQDLDWWRTFLPHWNGTASFLEPDWTTSDVLHLYTDASATLGLGAFYHDEWFQLRWPEWILQSPPSIEYLEMVPILLAMIVWGPKLRRRRVVFHTDNAGAVEAWAHLRSSSPGVLDLMRRMTRAAADNNFTLTLKHVRGVDNGIADALSRFQTQRFRILAPRASVSPTSCPDIFASLQVSYNQAEHSLAHTSPPLPEQRTTHH
ncbi:uncharacterized protein LOC129596648 [Paramacrobiotus metropolitanus]|uniref:uncharacterized protein LOC129596648 n=1 Tax=Paramacrobiotus metropolitanus TaxID=2943436 RepID=UPI0024460A1C|nr:uncharacterized protein LOC129596648 [Paramacrobiotus metropolitanus]